jgi:hypothetical protein
MNEGKRKVAEGFSLHTPNPLSPRGEGRSEGVIVIASEARVVKCVTKHV